MQIINVLKRELKRQREENEVLEANVREQVVSEMMEVISEMQEGFRWVCLVLIKKCICIKCHRKQRKKYENTETEWIYLGVFSPYRESLEAERALLEERCDDKIANLQKHLKQFYKEELEVRVHFYTFQPNDVVSLQTLFDVSMLRLKPTT